MRLQVQIPQPFALSWAGELASIYAHQVEGTGMFQMIENDAFFLYVNKFNTAILSMHSLQCQSGMVM